MHFSLVVSREKKFRGKEPSLLLWLLEFSHKPLCALISLFYVDLAEWVAFRMRHFTIIHLRGFVLCRWIVLGAVVRAVWTQQAKSFPFENCYSIPLLSIRRPHCCSFCLKSPASCPAQLLFFLQDSSWALPLPGSFSWHLPWPPALRALPVCSTSTLGLPGAWQSSPSLHWLMRADGWKPSMKYMKYRSGSQVSLYPWHLAEGLAQG